MTAELKPCPFCSNITYLRIFPYKDSHHHIICYVGAGGCGASSGRYRSRNEAISAWNRRDGEKLAAAKEGK